MHLCTVPLCPMILKLIRQQFLSWVAKDMAFQGKTCACLSHFSTMVEKLFKSVCLDERLWACEINVRGQYYYILYGFPKLFNETLPSNFKMRVKWEEKRFHMEEKTKSMTSQLENIELTFPTFLRVQPNPERNNAFQETILSHFTLKSLRT